MPDAALILRRTYEVTAVPLQAGMNTVGASPVASIGIPRAYGVTTLHALIVRQGLDTHVIAVGGSRGEIEVNGSPVAYALLAPGDHLILGSLSCEFASGDSGSAWPGDALIRRLTRDECDCLQAFDRLIPPGCGATRAPDEALASALVMTACRARRLAADVCRKFGVRPGDHGGVVELARHLLPELLSVDVGDLVVQFYEATLQRRLLDHITARTCGPGQTCDEEKRLAAIIAFLETRSTVAPTAGPDGRAAEIAVAWPSRTVPPSDGSAGPGARRRWDLQPPAGRR